MNSSPKQNTIIALCIQIICIRIYWQIFLAFRMIGKIPAHEQQHNTALQVCVRCKTKLESFGHYKYKTICNMCITLCPIQVTITYFIISS